MSKIYLTDADLADPAYAEFYHEVIGPAGGADGFNELSAAAQEAAVNRHVGHLVGSWSAYYDSKGYDIGNAAGWYGPPAQAPQPEPARDRKALPAPRRIGAFGRLLGRLRPAGQEG